MDFYGRNKFKSPSKRRRHRLRKQRFLTQFREDPVLIPVHGSETSLALGPVSDPDTVTVKVMHLAMQRLEAVQDDCIG